MQRAVPQRRDLQSDRVSKAELRQLQLDRLRLGVTSLLGRLCGIEMVWLGVVVAAGG
jgi:hypothetical protein